MSTSRSYLEDWGDYQLRFEELLQKRQLIIQHLIAHLETKLDSLIAGQMLYNMTQPTGPSNLLESNHCNEDFWVVGYDLHKKITELKRLKSDYFDLKLPNPVKYTEWRGN